MRERERGGEGEDGRGRAVCDDCIVVSGVAMIEAMGWEGTAALKGCGV